MPQNVNFGLTTFSQIIIRSTDGSPIFRGIIDIQTAADFDNPSCAEGDLTVMDFF